MWINTENSRNNFWSVILKHAIAWALYIGYEFAYLYVMTGTISNIPNSFLNYFLNGCLFYFNAHVLLNYTVSKKNTPWIFIGLLIFLEIVFFVGIKYPINLLVFGYHLQITSIDDYHVYAVSNALRSFYYVSISTAYFLAVLNVKRTKKIIELENQRLIQQTERILLQKDLLQSRNAYLQAQVNPHLLFNTLNFMYNASAKVSEKLAGAVMTLSDIMRYALTNIDDDDKVLLEKEASHINNYIQLNQVRYEDKLNIDFNMQGSTYGLRIIPLALITLIENMFKYGDLLDPNTPAKIDLTVEDGKLELALFNKKRANRRIHGHGTGIANLRERLEIYYPDKYSLEVNDMENTYAIKLNLILNE